MPGPVTFRTFLYAVRDGDALRLKYGYMSCLDLQTARTAVKGRYRCCYYLCDVLQVVPVSLKGTEAENLLKERLRSYHVGREFLQFPDEPTLQASLRDAYAALACEESAAHEKLSHRGDAALRAERRRERAEMAAKKHEEIRASRKRSLEVAEEKEAAKRMRIARRQQTARMQDGLPRLPSWAAEHICVGTKRDFITKNALQQKLQASGLAIAPHQLKRQICTLFAEFDIVCKEQHCVDGKRHRSAFVSLRWKI